MTSSHGSQGLAGKLRSSRETTNRKPRAAASSRTRTARNPQAHKQ